MKSTPTNSPRKKDHVTPEAVETTGPTGHKATHRDQQGCGDPRIQRPGPECAPGARDAREEVDDHRHAATHGADHRPATLDAEHPALRHEDVRGVDRAEDEREGAGDVERRRHHPQVRGKRGARGNAGRRIQEIARRVIKKIFNGFIVGIDRVVLSRVIGNTKPKLSNSIRDEISRLYKDDIEELEVLVGKQISEWTKKPNNIGRGEIL